MYNVRQTGKNDYDIMIFRDMYIPLYTYTYFFSDYKYPTFFKQTWQSLYEHKSGFQVLISCLNLLI